MEAIFVLESTATVAGACTGTAYAVSANLYMLTTLYAVDWTTSMVDTHQILAYSACPVKCICLLDRLDKFLEPSPMG